MAESERLGMVFVRAVLSHTIQTVGGSLFATATAVWTLGAWMRPNLKPPGYQPWMLGAIAIGFYAFGAFKAWKDERTAKGKIQAEIRELKDSKPNPTIKVRRLQVGDDMRREDIRLAVTNNGPQAQFWVSIRVRGDTEEQRDCLLPWPGLDHPTRLMIPRGGTVELSLAHLLVKGPMVKEGCLCDLRV